MTAGKTNNNRYLSLGLTAIWKVMHIRGENLFPPHFHHPAELTG